MTERMLKFWVESGDWANKTFGDLNTRGVLGPLKHIVKEVEKEIKPIISRIESREGATVEEITEELVDLQHLIFDVARRLPITYSVFVAQCFEKLEINKKREWPRFTGDSTEAIEHNRDKDKG